MSRGNGITVAPYADGCAVCSAVVVNERFGNANGHIGQGRDDRFLTVDHLARTEASLGQGNLRACQALGGGIVLGPLVAFTHSVRVPVVSHACQCGCQAKSELSNLLGPRNMKCRS